ncbi:hypothetical protein NPIL_559971 [Nephila pilipes]|uniref:Uncharacterized protein n=1 Tax=Nephila pilipes TaxID=299642 RepID=A0A8X6PNR8_NEPPI|nr:hypothetical protein NPIL_559971 [Nephila pilipes]
MLASTLTSLPPHPRLCESSYAAIPIPSANDNLMISEVTVAFFLSLSLSSAPLFLARQKGGEDFARTLCDVYSLEENKLLLKRVGQSEGAFYEWTF